MGLEQHDRLGRWFRRRYGNVLSQSWNHLELEVISADLDRTLDSAAANLAALYADNFVEEPNREIVPGLKWAPVPIHTVPREFDLVSY